MRGEDDANPNEDVMDHDDEVDKHLEDLLDSHEEDHEEIGIDYPIDDHDDPDHDQSMEEMEEASAAEEEEE